MQALCVTGELWAHFAHAVAEGDHVIEAPVGELAQVLGPKPPDGQAASAHDAQRVWMQWLGRDARARRAKRPAGEPRRDRLSDLRSGAVAGAKEQHVGVFDAVLCRRAWCGGDEPWVQRASCIE